MDKQESKRFVDWLRSVNDGREELEVVLGDFIGGISGYAVAIIPAYWSAHHMISVLDVPEPIGALFGILFAMLEFAILSRFIQLYQYRTSGKAQKGSVSPWIPGSMLVFYLIVILLINGVLAFFDSIGKEYNDQLSIAMIELVRQWEQPEYIASVFVPAIVQTSVIFLSSLFSIPAAVTVTTGLQQRRFLQQREKEKKDRRKKTKEEKPPLPKSSPTSQKVKLKRGEKKLLSILDRDKNAMKNMTQLAELVGVSRPTLYKYDKDLRAAGYYKVTPAGTVFDLRDG